MIFDNILDRRFTIPANMPEPAIDLIQSLLKLHPLDRLGSGQKGSKLSFENLKNHEFFKGIQFLNLHKKSPPLGNDPICRISKNIKRHRTGPKNDLLE